MVPSPVPPPLADRLDPAFAPALERFEVDKLDQQRDTIFGLTAELELGYLNQGWFAFGAANGGAATLSRWTVGSNVLDAIHGPLSAFFRGVYERAAVATSPWEHAYECPSATVHRRLQMRLLPLGGGRLLVVNSVIAEWAVDVVPAHQGQAPYTDRRGLIVQCGHCRRVRRPDDSGAWDWVAGMVDRSPANTSHGLCEPCLGYFYPP